MTAAIIRRFRLAGSLLTLCVVFSAAAVAQPQATSVPAPSAALSESYAQLDTAWTGSPLGFTAAGFAEAPARHFGDFTPRASAIFAPGETLTVYVQPVGYGFVQSGETYSYEMTVSYKLITPSGQVLAAGDNFASIKGSSHSKDRQAFSSLNFTFEGLPTGIYRLETRVSDANTSKSGNMVLPFEIQAAQ